MIDQIEIVEGDITRQKVDAIVNAANRTDCSWRNHDFSPEK